ncbi:hypothetical protein [Chryseobacterium mucoviscidosis]|uniref:Uncharacterized protein n=1 Tax=Chryseobacterium mucoviscidosis TaxID=1945581 RepID=A0A202C8X7_9FLAO|nr:hypothetical protein [Chryseobacterium mucoviscidosis]OVE60217.1 hypothetical protein B0E34_04495 [Chryseobacterium mucoviscidosis]
MTKKMISWLSFIAVFLFLLHSCVHDEIYSSSDPASAEYHSKSLWKEDEKYIKNVMKVFDEYADKSYFASNFGDVYWDYATTMGTYDEKFLEVPVVKNGKINFILLVYREDDRIFFKRKDEESSKEFFKVLIFTDRVKNKLSGRILGAGGNTSKTFCYTVETTVEWTNDDGSPGPTFSHSETYCFPTGPSLPCQALDTESNCGGGYGNGGSGGSGGGSTGYPYPQNNQTPCEKTKNIVNKPQIKAKLTSLQSYANTNTKIESGFQELKSGTLVNGVVNGDNQIEFGIGPNSQGTVHTHQPGTIGIFAPQDIMTFLAIVHAQDANALGNAYSGTISSSGTYFINFTGTASDLPPAMTEAQEAAYVAATVKDYTEKYYKLLKAEGKKSYQTLSSIGLEKLFFDMLDKIGLAGKITLIKEDNGNTSTIQKDSSGNPIPNPC